MKIGDKVFFLFVDSELLNIISMYDIKIGCEEISEFVGKYRIKFKNGNHIMKSQVYSSKEQIMTHFIELVMWY